MEMNGETQTRELTSFQFARYAVGWLSFSVVFNVLNTIIYSALYPKLLERSVGSDKNFSVAFSIINFVTTLISAIVLPFLGSFVDQVKLIRLTMVLSQYLGIICTLGLFLIAFIPHLLTGLIFNLILYILALGFLRLAVMNNNAILPCFPQESITKLSLSSNFIGFSTNVFGLFILAYFGGKLPETGGISRENWWLLIFTSVCLVVSILVFLAPSGKSKINEEEPDIQRQPLLSVCKNTFVSIWETFVLMRTNRQYRKCWIFLLSYFFFSTTGTIITIYIVPLFIEIYKLSLDQVSLLNLYYKIAMVVGILIGFLFDQVTIGDVPMLMIHNVAFQGLLVLLYICIIVKVKYTAILLIPLAIGVLYSWNTSVARGLMGKIIPSEKKCEFMGFYSTFTYLGISLISVANAILRQLQLSPQTLLILVFVFTLPSYFFLWLLNREMKDESA